MTTENTQNIFERNQKRADKKAREALGVALAGSGMLLGGIALGGLHGAKAARKEHPSPIITYVAPTQSAEDEVLEKMAQASLDEGKAWDMKRVVEEYNKRLPEEIGRREQEKTAAYQAARDAGDARVEKLALGAMTGIGAGAVGAAGLVAGWIVFCKFRDKREKLQAQQGVQPTV